MTRTPGYYRWRRAAQRARAMGQPAPPWADGRKARAIPAAVRFWAKVDKSAGPEGCWIWTGRSHTPKGYGYFFVGGSRRMSTASRWSLEQALGRALDPEEFACHSCDTPLCVNPAHLFVGSNLANMADASRKGRLARRLSSEDVVAIREAMGRGALGTDLAQRYGVAHSTIYRVRNRQIWRNGASA